MRLFTAIDLSEPIRQRLMELVDQLRPSADLQWSPAANLHITIKFIGEWPEVRIGDLDAALRRVAAAGMRIDLPGLGWYPNPHSPRVLFAAVRAGGELEALAQSTDRACRLLGIPSESRPYSPHITLARIKRPVPLHALQAAIAKSVTNGFGTFTPAAFHLYQSTLGRSGSIYAKLRDYPIGEPSPATT